MKLQDFRFFEPLRVRWSEIDAQQVVFNAHYQSYFDVAVGGYWRALALPYVETMAQMGGDLFVRKATLEYLGSARYDELLQVGVRCERIGPQLAASDLRGVSWRRAAGPWRADLCVRRPPGPVAARGARRPAQLDRKLRGG